MPKLTTADFVVLTSAANGGAVGAVGMQVSDAAASWRTLLALAACGAFAGSLAGAYFVWTGRGRQDGQGKPFGRRDYLRMLVAFCFGLIVAPACLVWVVVLTCGVASVLVDWDS